MNGVEPGHDVIIVECKTCAGKFECLRSSFAAKEEECFACAFPDMQAPRRQDQVRTSVQGACSTMEP